MSVDPPKWNPRRDEPWRALAAEAWALLQLAVPIMLIALVNMGMSVTDTWMVSALYGADALASVAVASDLYSILFYLGAGVLAGLSPLYTAAVVKADPAERTRLERIGSTTILLLALVLVPVLWCAPDWLGLLSLDATLLERGRGFTRALALTLVPMLGVALYRTILTAAGKPHVFLKVTLAMLPLNAAANWVFMVGLGPIPSFGPAGAGIASLLVACTSVALLAWVARGSPDAARSGYGGRGIDPRGVALVLRVGVPIGIATVAEVGVSLAATIYAATLGSAEVAAHTLTLRLAGVVYAVPMALLQASMVRMARAEALGDRSLQRTVTHGSLILSTGLGIALCLALPRAANRWHACSSGRVPPGWRRHRSRCCWCSSSASPNWRSTPARRLPAC